jgi:hypothetical protein
MDAPTVIAPCSRSSVHRTPRPTGYRRLAFLTPLSAHTAMAEATASVARWTREEPHMSKGMNQKKQEKKKPAKTMKEKKAEKKEKKTAKGFAPA